MEDRHRRIFFTIALWLLTASITVALVFQILPLYHDPFAKTVVGLLLAVVVPAAVLRILPTDLGNITELQWDGAVFIVTAFLLLIVSTIVVPADAYLSTVAVIGIVVLAGIAGLLAGHRENQRTGP